MCSFTIREVVSYLGTPDQADKLPADRMLKGVVVYAVGWERGRAQVLPMVSMELMP